MISANISCLTCGSAVDVTLLGGVCPRCVLGDALLGAPAEAPFDRHELLGEIARGGMGVVYRARQLEPERIVALKTLRGASLDSPEALARFRHEAEVMVALDHPAILPVHHYGEQDGIPFFTMKLADGGTLADRIGEYATQWRRIAEMMIAVADAVQHAHDRGVLHRDLKPGNILFDAEGHAYVSDFGIAKLVDADAASLTQTLSVLGTPHYLAPEIAAGTARAASVVSDVWSLGVILYELLAGRRPFAGESVAEVLRALADHEPAPLRGVPRDLGVIALKALRKDPAQRYSSARALAEDLRCWLEGRPITARAVAGHERAWLWLKRNPVLAITSGLFLLALLTTAAALAWGYVRVKRENARVVASETETQRQFRAALLHQARSGRVSREMGWRRAGIEALQRAHALAPGADVRDELIAHLAGFDLTPQLRTFHDIVLPCPSLKYCLRTKDNTTAMAIARLDDLTNLFDVPDAYGGKLTAPVFARDESWVVVGTEKGVRALSMTGDHRELGHWPDMVLIGASTDRSLIHLGKDSHWRVVDTATWQEAAAGDLGRLTQSTASLVKKVPAFHQDRKFPLCAVADGDEVRVLDWRTGEELRRIKSVRPPQSYRWIGPNLIIGCGDIGQGFDFLREREVFFGPGFSAPNYLMAARGGAELLASSELRETGLWHLQSGQLLVRGRGLTVTTIAVDGVHFSGRSPRSEIGRIERPMLMQFLPDAISRGSITAAYRALALSPDGRLLAVHDRTQMVVHDVESGQLLAHMAAPETIALGFSSNGKNLLLVNPRGLEGWQLGRTQDRLTLTRAFEVSAPAGRTFVNGRMLQDGERFLVSTQRLKPYCETWRLHRDKLKWERQPAPESPTAGLTDVTPDGIFNIGGQNQYNVVNNIREKRFIYLEPDAIKNALGGFSPDGTQLVMVDATYDWKLFAQDAWLNPKKPTDMKQTVAVGGTVSGSHLPAWAKSGRWFAVSPDGKKVQLIDARSQEVHSTLESPIDLLLDTMVISEDERILALQRRGGSVEIWHLERLVAELAALGVKSTLPEFPARPPTPPELQGKFTEHELPAWSVKPTP